MYANQGLNCKKVLGNYENVPSKLDFQFSSMGDLSKFMPINKGLRDVLFEFHLKFWNTASIDIPARSLL